MLDELRQQQQQQDEPGGSETTHKRRRSRIDTVPVNGNEMDSAEIEDDKEEEDEEPVPQTRPKRRVKRERSGSSSNKRKTATAPVTVKEEPGIGEPDGATQPRAKGPHNKKEKMVTLEQTTRALEPMVQQYEATETYNEINAENTVHIHSIIRELEEYVYGMYGEGQVTQTLFNYCHRLIEAVNHWNGSVRSEQSNMRDFVLNSISYNKELHDLYIEHTKRPVGGTGPTTRHKRNPASPFNTVQVSPESITLSSVNHALISTNNNTNMIVESPPSTGQPPVDGPSHMKNIF